jgi:hypothetical protein
VAASDTLVFVPAALSKTTLSPPVGVPLMKVVGALVEFSVQFWVVVSQAVPLAPDQCR